MYKFYGVKIRIVVLAALTLIVSPVWSAEWNYNLSDDHYGPNAWGTIDGFETCGSGMKQSPIDLDATESKRSTNLEFDYEKTDLTVVNNGHTIQVNVNNDSALEVGKRSYRLLQFHFHTPSEHAVKGYQYPMEAHFVHINDNGVLAVVGVFIKQGSHNDDLQLILDNAPHDVGENVTDDSIKPQDLISSKLGYLRYSGSLTTPPCSEGVRWHVLEGEIEASYEQIEAFEVLLHHGNARSLQELNGRKIKYYKD
jgi:carbonic anhydrase